MEIQEETPGNSSKREQEPKLKVETYRLCIKGAKNSGKSSLIKRLRSGRFEENMIKKEVQWPKKHNLEKFELEISDYFEQQADCYIVTFDLGDE